MDKIFGISCLIWFLTPLGLVYWCFTWLKAMESAGMGFILLKMHLTCLKGTFRPIRLVFVLNRLKNDILLLL